MSVMPPGTQGCFQVLAHPAVQIVLVPSHGTHATGGPLGSPCQLPLPVVTGP